MSFSFDSTLAPKFELKVESLGLDSSLASNLGARVELTQLTQLQPRLNISHDICITTSQGLLNFSKLPYFSSSVTNISNYVHIYNLQVNGTIYLTHHFTRILPRCVSCHHKKNIKILQPLIRKKSKIMLMKSPLPVPLNESKVRLKFTDNFMAYVCTSTIC